MKTIYPSVASTFIWIGFVCAISFMEAWLKFQAPNITIPLGLGIGRIVFGALNKVEWFFSLFILINYFILKPKFVKHYIFFSIPFIILILQTIWMLPALDARAELHIQGADLPTSNLHFVYIAVEFMKVICLFIFGTKLLAKLQPIKK